MTFPPRHDVQFLRPPNPRFRTLLVAAFAVWALLGQTLPAQGLIEIPARVVGGHLVAKAEARAGAVRVPIHVMVDLGQQEGLRLHVNTARTLGLQSGSPVDLLFEGEGLEGLIPAVARYTELEQMTAAWAQDLEEIPVSGVLGTWALGDRKLVLDYARSLLTLAPGVREGPAKEPPEDPAESPALDPDAGIPTAPVELPLRAAGGISFVKVALDGERVVNAALGTHSHDTWIDADLAERLGCPAGDVPRAMLGTIDLTRYVALRPGQVQSSRDGGPSIVLGNGFLSHFRVTLDPVNRRLVLDPVREPVFPEADQEAFLALVAGDADALETFLDGHPGHRLGADAATALLGLRFNASDPAPEALVKSVEHLARELRPGIRTRTLLDFLGRVERGRPELLGAIQERTLELALEQAARDDDPKALHLAQSEIGGMLMEKGDLKGAYGYLLAAAFGLPRDGHVNLRLARLYEARGKGARAWSRYLQAAITADAGAEGLDGLKRLADETGVRTPYDAEAMERTLEGRVPAFEPASVHKVPPEGGTGRRVLAELFTGAHCRPCAAADLAFDGLTAHFSGGEVIVLEHHLPIPAAEPLVSPGSSRRGREKSVNATPTMLLDGREGPRGGGPVEKAGELFRTLRSAAESRLAAETPWTLALEGRLKDGAVEVTARVDGPAADNVRLRLWLVERTVLFPGVSTIVFHRYVSRAEFESGGVDLPPGAGERTVERRLDLAAVTAKLDKFVDSMEVAAGSDFPLRPTGIDPDKVAVVAFLETPAGEVLQASRWEAAPRAGE